MKLDEVRARARDGDLVKPPPPKPVTVSDFVIMLDLDVDPSIVAALERMEASSLSIPPMHYRCRSVVELPDAKKWISVPA